MLWIPNTAPYISRESRSLKNMRVYKKLFLSCHSLFLNKNMHRYYTKHNMHENDASSGIIFFRT